MMRARRVAATVVAVLLTTGVAALSRLPVTLTRSDEARLRLSWRLQGRAGEDCRRPSPEELERLPVHMRNPAACIGRITPYRLEVGVDGRTVVVDTLHAAGARADRPIYVFREIRLPPGDHRVAVRFRALTGALPGAEAGGDPPAAEDPPTGDSSAWAIDEVVRLREREIALVTYDRERRALTVRHGGG